MVSRGDHVRIRRRIEDDRRLRPGSDRPGSPGAARSRGSGGRTTSRRTHGRSSPRGRPVERLRTLQVADHQEVGQLHAVGGNGMLIMRAPRCIWSCPSGYVGRGRPGRSSSVGARPIGLTAPRRRGRVGPMIRVGSIVIRVDDLERQTAFWSAALDYVPRDDPRRRLHAAPAARRRRAEPLARQGAARRCRSRRRIHLDLYAEDQAGEVARLIALGRHRGPLGQAAAGRRLRDPRGPRGQPLLRRGRECIIRAESHDRIHYRLHFSREVCYRPDHVAHRQQWLKQKLLRPSRKARALGSDARTVRTDRSLQGRRIRGPRHHRVRGLCR